MFCGFGVHHGAIMVYTMVSTWCAPWCHKGGYLNKKYIKERYNKYIKTMSEKKTYMCEYCEATFAVRGNYYRHKKYMCSVKIEQEKKKSIDAQNETKLYYEKIIEDLKNESKITKEKLESELKVTRELLEQKNKELLLILHDDRTFFQGTHKSSSSTINKSVDALTFLMTHRKNAPELKKITQENAQALLTHENKLYDYLLHYNSENKLDQYIGDIILKYIKKENPEEQSVWNSDVSRLTFLIREIVDESPTWLRDPN